MARPNKKNKGKEEEEVISSPAEGTWGKADDMLLNRYKVHVDEPIDEYSSAICQAYAATDVTGEYNGIFALIGENTLPYRERATEVMQRGLVPHLVRCHATGRVTLTANQQTRRGYIFQRPKGKKFSEIVKHSGPLPEHFIIHQVVKPVVRMLAELESHDINHGCLNLNTLYFDKELTIEECSAVPSGYLQIPTYESPERLMVSGAGKGAGDLSCDYYALGIIVLHLYLGYLPHDKMSADELLASINERGAYNFFVPEVELSDMMQDILRGCINEARAERWGLPQMQGWLTGKRYNLVAPSVPRDSVRPFEFRDRHFFTRRGIANALNKDWKMAKLALSGYQLQRWLESNIKSSDVVSHLERVIPIGVDDAPTRALKDEELARLLLVLDPVAPIRYKMSTTHLDGIGPALSMAFHEKNKRVIKEINEAVNHNLFIFADEMKRSFQNALNKQIIWAIQALKPIMGINALGFGVERTLYELNPTLCCQHPELIGHYIYSLRDMMRVLDNIALVQMKAGKTLVNKHIAAFITHRLEIYREIKVNELRGVGDLVTDERYLMLKLLTIAQQNLGNEPYPNLSRWAFEMILPALELIKQKSVREKLTKRIRKGVDRGVMESFTFLLFNKALFEKDFKEHQRAFALFRFHEEMVNFLSNDQKIRVKARYIGQQMAWYMGALVMLAIVIMVSRGGGMNL